MFRTVPLSIIRSFSLYTQDQDGTAFPSWSCSQAVSKPVWHIPLLRVQWKNPDNGQRNCPKHVEFLELKSTCFGQFLCPSSVFHCTHSKPVWHIPLLRVQWKKSWWWTEELSETYRIFGIKVYIFRTVPLSIISFSLYTQQTCMTYTIAACTVRKFWWWTEELSETCRDFIPKNKFEKLVHLVGFIIRTHFTVVQPFAKALYCSWLRVKRKKTCTCFILSNNISYAPINWHVARVHKQRIRFF